MKLKQMDKQELSLDSKQSGIKTTTNKNNPNYISSQHIIEELLNKVKTSIESREYDKTEQYLNLILLYSPLDFNHELKAFTYYFSMNRINKREEELSRIIRYYIYHLNNSFQDITNQNLDNIIKQLFQYAEILHHNKNYSLAYYIYNYIKTSDLNKIISEKQSIELQANINETYKELAQKINKEKEKYISNKYQTDLKKLQALFIDKKYTLPSEKKDCYYIVSTKWLKTFMYFLSVLKTNNRSLLDKAFLSSKVAYIYYRKDISNDEAHKYLPCYPGPINNYHIIEENDCWYDPKEECAYTNVYLSNQAIEDQDFKTIDKDTYGLLKKVFTVNYEIERKLLDNDYNELQLLKFQLLILCPLMYNHQSAALRVRNIQISKNSTIKEFKAKIVRFLNWEVYRNSDKSLFTKPVFKIIIPEFPQDQKNDIYQIMTSYYSKFSVYKPKLKGVEIKKNSEIFENLKLGDNDLLIVEVKNDDIEANWFISLLTMEDYAKCNLCNKSISGKKFPCPDCTLYNYCSNECKEKDTKHKTHHQNLDSLYKKKFALHDMLCVDINTIINHSSRHGLTGQKNIGNTCFMNSAIQCLSNCEELTKYFLMNKHKEEINKKKKYGSGGIIAKAYYELIDQLWNGNSPYISPWDFKQAFSNSFKQFAGSCQQDSHEFLAFFLDALHEDLNRVHTKPYRELTEKIEAETEVEASLRWWQGHVDRENSIIVDLFHGQYKNGVKCPQCHRVNIIYDPLMHLGLPIPVPQSKIKVKVILDKDEIDSKVFYYNCNEGTVVGDIKGKLLHELENTVGFIKNQKIKYVIEGITVDYQKRFKRYILNEERIMNYYLNKEEAIFYLYDYYDPNGYNFYVSPVIIEADKSTNAKHVSNVKNLFYPKLFNMRLEMTVKEINFMLFVYYRKLIQDLPNHTYKMFLSNKNTFNYHNDEFINYFELKDSIPFKLHIVNNVPPKAAFSCEYCNRSCSHCQFKFELTQTVKTIQLTQKIVRPFLIYVEILLYNKQQMTDNNDENKQDLITKNKDITIYDCLESFRTEEKLEKDNSWYCSTCKSRQEAFKKMEIFRAPNILIIQLKRFRIKSANMYSGGLQNKKNDSLVIFPINDLDLRQFIVEENSKKEGIYDLFAISQHFGSLTGGHYTALCKNGGEWYDFNDEKVNRYDTKDIVTNAAYLLFYRKKTLNQLN